MSYSLYNLPIIWVGDFVNFGKFGGVIRFVSVGLFQLR